MINNQQSASKQSKLATGQAIDNHSFTLVELIVVVAITGIIAVMVFANMRSGGRSVDVNSAAEKLAGIIKQAQMMALSGKQISGSRPDYGYGVYLDTSTSPDSYKLFINDFNVNNYEYDAGSDTVIQSFDLPEQISLTTNYTSIIFKPPRGEIWVSNGSGGSKLTGATTVLISLQHVDINFYAYVGVNSQGEIDVRKTE